MHHDDVFEGLSVLDDVPGEVGIVLWQSLRDVGLWSGAPREERAVLFAAGSGANRMASLLAAGVPAGLETPLATLARMTDDPAGAREENVALACREISQWLDERSLLASALAFAQAAAGAAVGDAATAFSVGRLARRRAEYARAETWLRRTVALARHSGDWHHYSRAFISLGTLYLQRGNLPVARRFLQRALRSARVHGMRDLEAYALHDLFTLSGEGGNVREANDYAREAMDAYGPGHTRLPMLAHDVATFWTSQGSFARAVPVLRSVLQHFERRADRAVVLSVLARAAGGAGDRLTFRSAWEETTEVLRTERMEEMEAEIWLEMAHGAVSLGEWDNAAEAASNALELATRRNQGKTRLTAEAVLDSVARHRTALDRAAVTASPAASEYDPADALAEDFVRSLELVGA